MNRFLLKRFLVDVAMVVGTILVVLFVAWAHLHLVHRCCWPTIR